MISSVALLLAISLAAFQAPAESGGFTRFLYCHEYSRGDYESQCVEMNPNGRGAVRYKLQDPVRATEEIELTVALSPAALSRFSSALAGTRFLADGAKYESSKKNIADLGKKRMVVDSPAGHREAVFNYSELKEVQNLTRFLDDLIAQEMALASMEAAQKYQRLSIPQWLDRVSNLIDGGRIVDPEHAAVVLEKLQADTKVLDSARDLAGKIRARLLKKK